MAPRKPKTKAPAHEEENPNAHILGAGDIVSQQIVDTLETNYMPYAMSVIMSPCLRLTVSNRLTESSFTPCTRWAF